jgi:DNA-directed RNA polymerase subunit RPC12/RpoP
MKNMDENKCMDCGADLTSKKRYPVYSARLAVLGYRCAECHEKSKTPGARKREEEISKLTKEVPKLENVAQNIRKALDKK